MSTNKSHFAILNSVLVESECLKLANQQVYIELVCLLSTFPLCSMFWENNNNKKNNTGDTNYKKHVLNVVLDVNKTVMFQFQQALH